MPNIFGVVASSRRPWLSRYWAQYFLSYDEYPTSDTDGRQCVGRAEGMKPLFVGGKGKRKMKCCAVNTKEGLADRRKQGGRTGKR